MFRDETILYSFEGPWGVRVDVGQSLIFLMGLLVWFNLNGDPVFAILAPILLMLAIYLHELGHAWGNIVQGVPVARVMLYGGGGYCQSARSQSAHEAELIVAMGPIVNLALWAICSLTDFWLSEYWVTSGTYPGDFAWDALYYVWLFGFMNLMLFAFNMIPVQPLDGGKLFHLLLLRLTPPDMAQRITGGVGFVLAIAWIPAMVALLYFQGWVLFFIPSIAAHYRMMRGAAAY
ncbi:MAG: site-2 protease family protein [Pseudomonadota bacterium]